MLHCAYMTLLMSRNKERSLFEGEEKGRAEKEKSELSEQKGKIGNVDSGQGRKWREKGVVGRNNGREEGGSSEKRV